MKKEEYFLEDKELISKEIDYVYNTSIGNVFNYILYLYDVIYYF